MDNLFDKKPKSSSNSFFIQSRITENISY